MGGLSPISRKRCVTFLSADSWIMSSWGCPSYHCHRTKLIYQFKPMFLSILVSECNDLSIWFNWLMPTIKALPKRTYGLEDGV